jgi:hypothetical protein
MTKISIPATHTGALPITADKTATLHHETTSHALVQAGIVQETTRTMAGETKVETAAQPMVTIAAREETCATTLHS